MIDRTQDLITAVNGKTGELDMWLETVDENELRQAIKAVMGPQRSLRDWFAGQALVALMSQPDWRQIDIPKNAYGEADAMLAERERGK